MTGLKVAGLSALEILDSRAALHRELTDRKLSTGLGDEGGFAPEITEPEEVLRLLVGAIAAAGYQPGRDGISIALDLAASEFRQAEGTYLVSGVPLSSGDPHRPAGRHHRRLPGASHRGRPGRGRRRGVELVGDDNFCTNPSSPGPSRAASRMRR